MFGALLVNNEVQISGLHFMRLCVLVNRNKNAKLNFITYVQTTEDVLSVVHHSIEIRGLCKIFGTFH